MRRIKRLSITIAVAILVFFCPAAWAQSITFVQLTDAHLFDAGKHRLPPGAREEFLENRAALDWAILETNRLQAGGKAIDFVVFTGDLGLEALKPGQDKAATADLARSFRALLVQMVYFIPGNNDLRKEEPTDIGHYREFLDRLKPLLPEHNLFDLTQTTQTVRGIRVFGLDSSTFKNDRGKTSGAHHAYQLREMQRVRAAILADQPCVIFTHIPDLEDPYRGPSGKDVHPSWNLQPDVERLWREIIARKEVLAVFAGHFHDSRRAIYAQDYSWAENKPDETTAKKTWVAPPLALKRQEDAPLLARGFLLVTLTATGKVTVEPHWFAYADETSATDKADKLIEGDADARDGDWKKAAEAYKGALGSKDAGVRAAAEHGYDLARAHMRRWYWPLESLAPLRWAALHAVVAAIVLLLVVIYVGWRCSRWRPIIEMPTKVSQDAPVEVFAAAMAVAAGRIRRVYELEGQRWSAGFDLRRIMGPGEEPLFSLVPMPSTSFLQDIADAVPEIQGVSLGKIVKAVRALIHFFDWRVESGLALTSGGDTTAYASLRRGWVTRGTWIESLAAPPAPAPPQQGGTPPAAAQPRAPAQPLATLPALAPESEATERLCEVAWRLACDIVGADLLR